MSQQIEDKEGWLVRARKKSRLVLVDNETFEEQWHMSISSLQIFSLIILSAIALIAITYFSIAKSPLKEFIPGYPDGSERKRAISNQFRLDSMQNVLARYEKYTADLHLILQGEDLTESVEVESKVKDNDLKTVNQLDFTRSKDDSLLRNRIESQKLQQVGFENMESSEALQDVSFFKPLDGSISKKINRKEDHFGIDIVAAKDEVIKSTLDGTVIFSSWTPNDGHVIQVQHHHNIISVYKHNSNLLKKVGQMVKSGDPIAVIGNTGKTSDGPHLHFELWKDGQAIDPLNYIAF